MSELFVIIQPAFPSIVRNFGVYFFASQLVQTNIHRVLLNGAKGCQQFEIYGPILSLLTVQQSFSHKRTLRPLLALSQPVDLELGLGCGLGEDLPDCHKFIKSRSPTHATIGMRQCNRQPRGSP